MLLEIVIDGVTDGHDDKYQKNRLNDRREDPHDGENQPKGQQDDNNHPHCFDHGHRSPLS